MAGKGRSVGSGGVGVVVGKGRSVGSSSRYSWSIK